MSKITWDNVGEKYYETGVSCGVLYKQVNGAYPAGVGWSGLTSVTESPDGAEANDIYADNIKYGSIRSAETFGGSIGAYIYPDEWEECDGSRSPVAGMYLGQQSRVAFGLTYRTEIGSDATSEAGYKLHLVYGATAAPSERSHETINDSPDPMEMSWDFDTVPVPVTGYRPVAHLWFDSRRVNATKLAALEAILYGTDPDPNDVSDEGTTARLPLPAEIITMMTTQ